MIGNVVSTWAVGTCSPRGASVLVAVALLLGIECFGGRGLCWAEREGHGVETRPGDRIYPRWDLRSVTHTTGLSAFPRFDTGGAWNGVYRDESTVSQKRYLRAYWFSRLASKRPLSSHPSFPTLRLQHEAPASPAARACPVWPLASACSGELVDRAPAGGCEAHSPC